MDSSKLIHGFVKVATWIYVTCQSCYMDLRYADLSKFFYVIHALHLTKPGGGLTKLVEC